MEAIRRALEEDDCGLQVSIQLAGDAETTMVVVVAIKAAAPSSHRHGVVGSAPYPRPVVTQTWGVPIEADRALNLPVEQVALHLLRGFQRGGDQNRGNFLIGAGNAYRENGLKGDQADAVLRALAEAYDWLILHGLLSGKPPQQDWLFITRKGIAILGAPDGLRLLRAEARLEVDLHPSIAARVRAQFLLGEYELAAFAAMRQVEIRVRELASADAGDLGVPLMAKAFRDGGPLADTNSERGEQVAMMNLFQGAIGVFKNPSSHRQVDYSDPTLASEVVLLADLLLRLLDARSELRG
jgi:uncharacterized protein (TIGR02391 family)